MPRSSSIFQAIAFHDFFEWHGLRLPGSNVDQPLLGKVQVLVDGQGNTVEFFLSRTRGIAAAKAFFRKALKHHREPHSITLDGHRPSHSALRRMGMNGEFNFRGPNPVRIRCCQYLNNVVEQDHRRVKGRLRPMLGFKTFYNARRVIIGIELAQKIHKRQFAIPTPWQSNPAVVLKITLSEVAGPEIGCRGRREGVDWLGFRGGQKPHRASLYFGQVFRAFSGSI